MNLIEEGDFLRDQLMITIKIKFIKSFEDFQSGHLDKK